MVAFCVRHYLCSVNETRNRCLDLGLYKLLPSENLKLIIPSRNKNFNFSVPKLKIMVAKM